MTITIRPVRNPDTGSLVFLWQLFAGRALLAGGYCATRDDARNDARLCAATLSSP